MGNRSRSISLYAPVDLLRTARSRQSLARTGSRTAGAYIVLGFVAFECLYSLVQFSHLTWETAPG